MSGKTVTVPCKCNQADPEPCDIHDSMTKQELKMRHKMCQLAIREVQNMGDPHDVIGIYRLQAQNIQAARRKRRDKSDKPAPTVIGLNTGTIKGKVLPGGG